MKKLFGEYRIWHTKDTWGRASQKARKSEVQAKADCRKLALEDLHNKIVEFRIVDGAGDVVLKSHIGSSPNLTWYEEMSR